MSKITLGNIIGSKDIEDFEDFELTEVQAVLKALGSDQPFDLGQSEFLQQRSLYASELLIDMIAKLVKTSVFLESKINSVKNKIALEYKTTDGTRLTADLRRQAGECAPEVEALTFKLAKAKGAKIALEKKYDVLSKMHYHLKELAATQKQSIIGGGSKVNISFSPDKEEKEIVNGKTSWK